MLAKCLLLVAAFGAAVTAPSVTASKCMAEQSEYFIAGRVSQSGQGNPNAFDIVGKFSADYKAEVEAIVMRVYMNGANVVNYTNIRMNNVSYIIDSEKHCQKAPGITIMQLCADSPQLKLLDSWYMGKQMTDTYYYEDKASSLKMKMTMFREDFSRATAVMDQTYGSLKQETNVVFGNETLGIEDPSVFNIPSYC